jgi:hypothetical protein
VNSLGELFDHLPIERRDVVRFSARHETSVVDDFTIDPISARVVISV